jgi:hypothetical protein
MEPESKLSDEECREMFRLLHRYASTELDQFEDFKFDTKFGKVFVSISRSAQGHDEAFTDINHLLGADS